MSSGRLLRTKTALDTPTPRMAGIRVPAVPGQHVGREATPDSSRPIGIKVFEGLGLSGLEELPPAVVFDNLDGSDVIQPLGGWGRTSRT